MPENQLVSIIMNCYNGEKYLQEALDSIIDQTYKNWELIFWDNQSIDNSTNIVLSYNDHRIKYFYSKFFRHRARSKPNLFNYYLGTQYIFYGKHHSPVW